MPHHHGRYGTSAGVKQSGGASPHGQQPAHKTSVSSGAAHRQKKAVQASIDKQPKKNIVTKVVDAATAFATNRRKTAYNVANIVPGMKKGLIKSRKDYKDYLISKGNTADFLNTDDDTLASFDTFEQVRTYKPTGGALNYADYLASKGNYNLQRSGNVGGVGEIGGEGGSSNVVKKVVGGQTILAQGPTEAEVSQSEATNAAETKLTKRRVKARGRKMNIYSQSKDKLTLGKKTLLGYV